ncbi:MAG: hypothetical protein GY941_21030 [Planctomycetes bacterium]|nr:hypothetical protein [Planctomycetota bacterium]
MSDVLDGTHPKGSIAHSVQQMQLQYIEKSYTPIKYTLPHVAGLDWPCGNLGAIAAFIYNSSPRPVKEVAITAALGLMAGIVGRAYHTESQSGLNLYIILVARSGVGKETMHSGISLISKNLKPINSLSENFVDFRDFTSAGGLIRACRDRPSFVNVSGEWGRKLQRMAREDLRGGVMSELRTVMTNLYQKSGPDSMVGGVGALKLTDDIADTQSIAYSMIGESTPETFYNSLTRSMMEDGFLSRFTVIKYEGNRPPANANPVLTMQPDLLKLLSSIITQCGSMVTNNKSMTVPLGKKAYKLLGLGQTLDIYCDNKIDSCGDDESKRQLWNRAHLKALRMASVLAVTDNYLRPKVTKHHAYWAINTVLADIKHMSGQLSSKN